MTAKMFRSTQRRSNSALLTTASACCAAHAARQYADVRWHGTMAYTVLTSAYPREPVPSQVEATKLESPTTGSQIRGLTHGSRAKPWRDL